MSDWRTAVELLALMGLRGVGPSKAISVARGDLEVETLIDASEMSRLLEEAEARVRECEEADVQVIGFFDDEFPAALREIPKSPAVLYVRGSTEWPNPALAVVGTREPSTFGETATARLTRAAAARGVAIISGLALGVDAIAHEAALNENGMTVAVLGNGLDSVSPRKHRDLARRIVEAGGSLVSEQPFGVVASPHTLVSRNRLQSGLATALLVGQTGVKGGTLHTVRFAAEQGRQVFCPKPSSLTSKSEGLAILLDRPARELPELLPAWKDQRRLAERLGTHPLASPVTAQTTQTWLNAIANAKPQTHPGEVSGQLTFES